MKAIIWVDENGRKRRSLVKDTDSPEMARYGVPADPPNIRGIDVDVIFSEIEALQYEHGLFDWRAAQNNQAAMQACINVFKRHFLELYRNL